MAKKVLTVIKLQAPGGQASPAPPVGPALGQHGVNIMEFVKAFNAQTQSDAGTVIPVEITVFEDRTFTFISPTLGPGNFAHSDSMWMARVGLNVKLGFDPAVPTY